MSLHLVAALFLISGIFVSVNFAGVEQKHSDGGIPCIQGKIQSFFYILSTMVSIIYIERDYCENVCISVDMQTRQKIYFKISKNLIYDFR
jgi:hypothetical protein